MAKMKNESVLTKKEIHLNKHDEDKLLLFVTGMMFGVGISAAILGAFMYATLVAIIFGLVLLLIEIRHESK